MNQETLNTIIKEHKLWLKDNTKGKRANLSGADLRGTNLSRADLSYARLIGADITGNNLSRANLSEADLSEANLREADLREADLSGANLNGANLIRANLIRANLNRAKGILSFNGSQHLLVYFKYDNIHYFKIGCMTYTRELWLENFDRIGKDQNYSDSEIDIYGKVIKTFSNIEIGE